jgi:hypothetical protein
MIQPLKSRNFLYKQLPGFSGYGFRYPIARRLELVTTHKRVVGAVEWEKIRLGNKIWAVNIVRFDLDKKYLPFGFAEKLTDEFISLINSVYKNVKFIVARSRASGILALVFRRLQQRLGNPDVLRIPEESKTVTAFRLNESFWRSKVPETLARRLLESPENAPEEDSVFGDFYDNPTDIQSLLASIKNRLVQAADKDIDIEIVAEIEARDNLYLEDVPSEVLSKDEDIIKFSECANEAEYALARNVLAEKLKPRGMRYYRTEGHSDNGLVAVFYLNWKRALSYLVFKAAVTQDEWFKKFLFNAGDSDLFISTSDGTWCEWFSELDYQEAENCFPEKFKNYIELNVEFQKNPELMELYDLQTILEFSHAQNPDYYFEFINKLGLYRPDE